MMPPKRLKPVTPQSQVKLSTTEPLHSSRMCMRLGVVLRLNLLTTYEALHIIGESLTDSASF